MTDDLVSRTERTKITFLIRGSAGLTCVSILLFVESKNFQNRIRHVYGGGGRGGREREKDAWGKKGVWEARGPIGRGGREGEGEGEGEETRAISEKVEESKLSGTGFE